MSYDPCPAGAAGVTDLGHGVRIRFFENQRVDTQPAGLIESHDRPDGGGRCAGTVHFDRQPVDARHPATPLWIVVDEDPLTLAPSLLCRTCGHHGFIRDGRWVPA